MIHTRIEKKNAKGWFAGPWNSNLPVAVGYANEAIHELHYHAEMYEVYLVAKGKSTAVVGGKKIFLRSGDLLVIEPKEIHTFINNSKDYLHFVLHAPFVKGDKVLVQANTLRPAGSKRERRTAVESHKTQARQSGHTRRGRL